MNFLQRLLWTPLSDLFHGKITGRGNWKQRVNDARLADEIDTAIRTSAKAQRFWRRPDHAVSLIESSQTSLAAGRTVRQIVDAIRADMGSQEADDSDEPLPLAVVAAVKQVVAQTKVRAAKRRVIANELFLHARTLLQQGTSAETIADGLTESLTLPALIQQTGATPEVIDLSLPEQIRVVINDVIRRTRLWKSEKADVACELASHFRGGLDSRQTVEELIESFGPIKAAASLIRRSRIRCRPLTWQLWRRSWQIAAVALGMIVVCWSILIVRFRSATPRITFDWVAEQDAVASTIPVDDRAWPLYREGLMKLGPNPSEALSRFTGKERAILVLRNGPVSAEWPQAVKFLDAHSKSVEFFLRGTARPKFGFVLRSPDNTEWIRWSRNGLSPETYNAPGTPLYATLLEHIHELTTINAFISGQMFKAAEDDDPDTVLRCFTGLLRLGEHAREDGLTVSPLSGLWQVRRAGTSIAWIVQTYPRLFNDEQLREMHDVLTTVVRTDWGIDPSRHAQVFFDEFLQHAYSPDGRFTPKGLEYLWESTKFDSETPEFDFAYIDSIDLDDASTPWAERLLFDIRGSEAAAWIADRETMKRKFAEIQLMSRREFFDPTWTEEASEFRKEVSRLTNSWTLRRRFLPIVVMAQSWLLDVSRQRGANSSRLGPLLMHAECQGATVAVALEQFRRSNSRWPKDLTELTPEFLATVPSDPIDNQPLHYRLADGVPHLYSVGPDRLDDGGKPVVPAKWLSEDALGDWLLSPVKLD